MAEKVITTKRDDLILELNRLVGVELKNTPKKVLNIYSGYATRMLSIILEPMEFILKNSTRIDQPLIFYSLSKGIIKYRHVGPVTEKIYKKINLLIHKVNDEN